MEMTRNNVKQRDFLGRLLVTLRRAVMYGGASKRAGFSLADVHTISSPMTHSSSSPQRK